MRSASAITYHGVGYAATNLDFIMPLVNSAHPDSLSYDFSHWLPGHVCLVLTIDLQPNSPAQLHISGVGEKPCPELQTTWLGF